ncbi:MULTISPECIES: hypothetical protein [unclassified Cupriavidus]|uniref:hypothetical protein n=1 Tax=unclassified Cupriavidus TaxID=2640874 RepID=UPI000421C9D3|nr:MULTISPECIES: hypothetical protein [unclassified Cupriavidus]MBP0630371.1 hypothetical protein [Cupriavidus sp. AcVe19-1a]MBP0638702.1 hypothetical protein [Cupriavidus sp. AcVe19-6a]
MTYSLSRSEVDSITEDDVKCSTMKLLPAWDDIPADFRNGNLYTHLAEARLLDYQLPGISISFLPEFDDAAACQAIDRCINAHLNAFAPRHQHRIAGVGYMISKVCTVTRVGSGDANAEHHACNGA